MQHSVDAIVAGHLCLDIIPELGHLRGNPADLWQPGSLHQVGKAVLATGGAVSNTGIAMHRLGLKTRLLGKVGDDSFGGIVRDLLSSVHASLGESIIVSAGEDTSYSLVLAPGSCDRMFLHHPGANDTYTADDVPAPSLAGGRLLHFGYPTCMRQFYSDGGLQLQRLFANAKSHGLTTSLDMAQVDRHSDAARVDWPSLLRRVLPLVDLFMPSLDEISFMLGYNAISPSTAMLDDVASELLKMGTSIVGLKLGDQGFYLKTTSDSQKLAEAGVAAPNKQWVNRQLLAPCLEVEVAGTTGSGDCTIAGFLAALLNGVSPERAMTLAVAVGAFCVERADSTSGVPTWQALQHRLSQPWARKPMRLAMEGWSWSERSAMWVGPLDAKELP